MQQPNTASVLMDRPSPDMSAEKVLLGHITGVFGLQGWLKVHSDTNPRQNITKYKHWWLKQGGQWKQWTVTGGRPQGKTIVVQLEGISSPEDASGLIGASIAVSRSDMPGLKPGEYYWADLIGMHVQTVDGADIGSVLRLFETGANDVLVVSDDRPEHQDSRKEVLVPWLVPDVVTRIDTENRIITVDWDPDF